MCRECCREPPSGRCGIELGDDSRPEIDASLLRDQVDADDDVGKLLGELIEARTRAGPALALALQLLDDIAGLAGLAGELVAAEGQVRDLIRAPFGLAGDVGGAECFKLLHGQTLIGMSTARTGLSSRVRISAGAPGSESLIWTVSPPSTPRISLR